MNSEDGGAGDTNDCFEQNETVVVEKLDQVVENGSGDNNTEVNEQEVTASK